MNEQPSTAQVVAASAALLAASGVFCALALPFALLGALLNIPSAICQGDNAPCACREL